MSIELLPTPPTRDDPQNFASRADAFLAKLPKFAEDANALAVEINTNAQTASAAALASIGASNATAWVSGSNPATGIVVWDTTNYLAYRRTSQTIAPNTSTRPGLTTAGWVLLTGQGNVTTDSVQTITADKTFTGTLSVATELSCGYGTPGEKRIRLSNDSRNTYLYLSTNSSVGLYDTAGSFSRWVSDTAGNFTTAGNVTAYSDIRLKTDLTKISNALSKVKELSGYTYKRIDTGEQQTGLLAQEVEKVLPEAVLSVNGTLSLAYGNIIGLLVEAIKELSTKVDLLENNK